MVSRASTENTLPRGIEIRRDHLWLVPLACPATAIDAYGLLRSAIDLGLLPRIGLTWAALRTACLTGVATVKMSKTVTTPDGNTIALTAGDVDEAVSGILTNGLAASDVNGESVPSGFSRIDAFRVGVLGEADRCFKRFA